MMAAATTVCSGGAAPRHSLVYEPSSLELRHVPVSLNHEMLGSLPRGPVLCGQSLLGYSVRSVICCEADQRDELHCSVHLAAFDNDPQWCLWCIPWRACTARSHPLFERTRTCRQWWYPAANGMGNVPRNARGFILWMAGRGRRSSMCWRLAPPGASVSLHLSTHPRALDPIHSLDGADKYPFSLGGMGRWSEGWHGKVTGLNAGRVAAGSACDVLWSSLLGRDDR